jgi:HlyD family secretion protein
VKTLIAWLVVATVCAAGGFLAHCYLPASSFLSSFMNNGSGQAPPVGSAKRHAVAALGRLEPEGEVIDIGVGALSTDRLNRLLVAEGQRVKAGEILAYLESSSERLAEREQIASQLAEARSRYAAETAYGNAVIKEAEIAIQQADKIELLDIEAQEAKVRAQEAELDNANIEMKRMTTLRPGAAASQSDYERQVLLVRRSKEDLANARTTLAKMKAARQIDLVKTRAQLETAKTSLARSLAGLPIDSLTRQLQLAEARLQLTIIRAPVAGQVLKIRTRPGEATGVRPILRLGRTDAMQAVAEVYYTDARLVRVGQKATITSPALTGPLTGKVAYVGAMVFKNDVLNIDPTADVDARVVEVRIRLDQDEVASRLTFLQVNVEIALEN